MGVRTQENPKYTVLFKEGRKEIREYAPYLVATTTVSGSYEVSKKIAFRKLAGFIFGNNSKKDNISMTAPVTHGESEKISMTAPVTHKKSSGRWIMTFMMPSKYTLETLPVPNDQSIRIEKVDKKYYGVIQYSGYDSVKKNNMEASKLAVWLEKNSDFSITSSPIFAGYNPPWTISFLRKNEIMFELKK